MKKIIGILAAAALLFAVSSCSNDDGTSTVDDAVTNAQDVSLVASEASAKAAEEAAKKSGGDEDEDEEEGSYSAISFNANDLTAGDIESDLKVSDTFTIHAVSGSKWTVDANSKTLSEISYTQRLKSVGKRSKADCVLEFDNVAAGTYTVDCASGSSSEERYFSIIDSDGTTTLATLAAPTTAGTVTFTLSSNKDAIYIGTANGVNFYGIHK